MVGQSADMSHQPDRPRGGAASGPMSRDAGLLRIRALTKGAALASALGAVAIGVVLAQPAQSQTASSPATTAPEGTGSGNVQAVPAPPPAQGEQPLAPPAQPPADAAPQAPPPAAVSGGS